VPIFAAGTYKIKEIVTVNGEKITLPQYAARMNIKLLRPADFNECIRERGIDNRLTVQEVCRVCKDEGEVRDALDKMSDEPMNIKEILTEAIDRNQTMFEFEKALSAN
jgi:hypothetical protein